MDVSNLTRREIGRLALEKTALKQVCFCSFFDLQNSLPETSSLELIKIIRNKEGCPNCGRREGGL